MELLSGLSLYSRSMLVVCAVLSLVIASEVLLIGTDSDAVIAAPTNTAADATRTVPATLQIPPVVTYREVVERPLFANSRRPPPDEAAAATESVRAVQLANKWKVTGIVVAGDDSFVHVESLRDHKTVRLQIGKPLDGWKLEEIEPDRIVFTSETDSVTRQFR